MRWLFLALLLVFSNAVWAQPGPGLANGINPGANLSAGNVTATGGVTNSLAAWMQNVNRVGFNLQGDCGAKGDGVTDDSAALAACVTLVNNSYSSGMPAYITVPDGIYLIGTSAGSLSGFARYTPGSIIGSGINKSIFVLSTSYSGNLFSWSDVFSNVASPGNTVSPTSNYNSPVIYGLTIIGDNISTNQQNAFTFYDTSQAIDMENVEIYNMNGWCMATGQTKNNTVSYMWESYFSNIKCWNSGTTSYPSIILGTIGTNVGQSTNEDSFYKLDIFGAKGTGLVISSNGSGAQTYALKFFGLRVEASTYDNVDIGVSADTGQIQAIDMEGLELFGAKSGYYNLKISAGSNQPYGIRLKALQIGSGDAGSGIDIDNARQVYVETNGFSTTGSNITIGASAGTSLVFWGDSSSVGSWTYSISTSYIYSTSLLTPFMAVGNPSSLGKTGAFALQGTTNTATALTLTADGGTASPVNTFCVRPSVGYNLSVQVSATDLTSGPSKYYEWTVPVAHFDAWYGGATGTYSGGTPQIVSAGTLTGLSVAVSSSGSYPCLNVVFTAPTGNTDTWDVDATILFTRSP